MALLQARQIRDQTATRAHMTDGTVLRHRDNRGGRQSGGYQCTLGRNRRGKYDLTEEDNGGVDTRALVHQCPPRTRGSSEVLHMMQLALLKDQRETDEDRVRRADEMRQVSELRHEESVCRQHEM